MSKEMVDAGETATYELWSDDWSKGFFKDSNVFSYFGPAWFIDFSMSADQDGSVGKDGGWAATEGPQGFYWGGTWITAATGTDNPTLVADIMRTMTTNVDVMKEIVTADNDFVNNKPAMEEMAKDESYGDAVLGGQNPLAMFCAGADKIDLSNMSIYDQGCNEEFQNAMKNYFEGNASYDEALDLPPGKIPFVLSQDDVSYYHYMDGDGFASKLVVDSNGEVKNEYIEDDGSVSTGDYDMVPLIDTFVKEHPDFSYHGRKGILAMTGYDGVLGYRTDIAYKTGKKLQDDQKKFLEDHPDFNYKQEVKNAKKVAKAMKAEGWEFASHTWGHKDVAATSLDDLKRDDKKWKKYVAPILGETDMIIFAFGADIGSWEGYSADNEKYEFYKSQGYRYFCNVDSSQYFVQITDDYFRQGRRNLDGYRMYYNPEMLSDLFDVSEVWDSSRPTPVPRM